MTRSSKPEKTGAERLAVENLICAKCDQPNPKNHNVCSRCGAHLHIVCHFCGHRNARIALHCVDCGKRLHRSIWRKLEKKLFRGGSKLTLWQIILLVVA